MKHRFKRALEIGTSTGHSAIWIAWALSKTGGKLVTLEIDPAATPRRVKNFEAAGVAPFVDARLGDAHELVKQLAGPFDFVFSDADKDWYTQYFKDVDPKLAAGRLLHGAQCHAAAAAAPPSSWTTSRACRATRRRSKAAAKASRSAASDRKAP